MTPKELIKQLKYADADAVFYLQKLKKARKERRQIIIKLKKQHNLSYADIGRKMGITRQRVAQIVRDG